MFEHLTDNPRRWRIGVTIFTFTGMTVITLVTSAESLWAAVAQGVAVGAISFFLAPEIRRGAQARLAARGERGQSD